MKSIKQKGFTLIELLVVISIISLLTSVILSALSDAKTKSRDVARIESVIQIRNALQMYFTDKGYYPAQSSMPSELVAGSYIEVVSSEIVYNGTTLVAGKGSACTVSNTSCMGYHIGIKLEKSNSVLNSDADSETGVLPDGLSTANKCATGTADSATDLCYDLVQ